MFDRTKSNVRAGDNQDRHDESPFGDPGDEPRDTSDHLRDFGAPYFRCLGVDGPTYFVQPNRVPDIVELNARSMTLPNFARLAPLQWWQVEYPAKSGKEGGVDLPAAMNTLIAACLARGTFDPSSAVGRGATMDGVHAVFHAGDRLFIDGRECVDLAFPGAKHTYLPRPALSLPGTTRTKHDFTILAQALAGWRWRDCHSAKILAGWIATAVIAGALDHRSHLWIIGGHGSAKTALMDFKKNLYGSRALIVDGSTTEAGVRQTLRGDALPVLIDEAEARDERSADRVGRLVEMARSSFSSSGVVAKGSAGGRAVSYAIRSAFSFASIAPSLNGPADRSRFLVLPLQGASSGQDLVDSRELCERLIASNFGAALIRRSIRLLPVIRRSTRTFANALVEAGYEPRTGDTLGGIAAGWWSLEYDREVTVLEAKQLVQGGWLGSVVDLNRAPTDAELAWDYLLTHRVSVNSSTEYTVAELISPEGDEPHGAVKALALRGFKLGEVDGRRCLLVATGVDGVKEHFRGSPWAATWPSILMGLPGAQKTDRTARFQGHNSRYVSIPTDR